MYLYIYVYVCIHIYMDTRPMCGTGNGDRMRLAMAIATRTASPTASHRGHLCPTCVGVLGCQSQCESVRVCWSAGVLECESVCVGVLEDTCTPPVLECKSVRA
jgi:hypothetical protein